MKKSKKEKKVEAPIERAIFNPTIQLKDLGTDKDPCFGKLYNLSTSECKQCGDSELCCIKFAEAQGVTRQELEKTSKFKDLEILIDKKAVFKSIRNHVRKGLSKSEIRDRIMAKYGLSKEEAKVIYQEFKLKKDKANGKD